MQVLFDADPGFVRWCEVENGNLSEHSCEFDSEWQNGVFAKIAGAQGLDAIAYLLYHGGEEIKSPMMRLSAASLMTIEKCIGLLPEHNEMTLKLARHGMTRFPRIPHCLLCDTAFFVDLPAEASAYAVPFKLREKGIRRYGGYGLCHQWAWEQARSRAKKPFRRVITAYLGNRTNVAAIKDGKPVETSIGFTPVEGIMSSNSCGDIDPTIVFQLISSGMSLKDINLLLSRESGMSGLLARQSDFSTLVKSPEDPEAAFVRQVFVHDIKKYLGAFVAILGGVDAIVFTGEHVKESLSVVLEICRSLEFLEIKCKSNVSETSDTSVLSETDSCVQAFCFEYNKWNCFAKYIRNSTTKEV
jgi:acetate kinase